MPKSGFSVLKLFEELKRRKVYTVATYYMVSSWLILQVSDVLFPAFGLPDTAMRPIVLILFFGLPVTVILAWAIDVTPEGISLTSEATPETRTRLRSRDYVTIGLLAILMAVAAVQQYLIFTRPSADSSAFLQGSTAAIETNGKAIEAAELDYQTWAAATSKTTIPN